MHVVTTNIMLYFFKISIFVLYQYTANFFRLQQYHFIKHIITFVAFSELIDIFVFIFGVCLSVLNNNAFFCPRYCLQQSSMKIYRLKMVVNYPLISTCSICMAPFTLICVCKHLESKKKK